MIRGNGRSIRIQESLKIITDLYILHRLYNRRGLLLRWIHAPKDVTPRNAKHDRQRLQNISGEVTVRTIPSNATENELNQITIVKYILNELPPRHEKEFIQNTTKTYYKWCIRTNRNINHRVFAISNAINHITSKTNCATNIIRPWYPFYLLSSLTYRNHCYYYYHHYFNCKIRAILTNILDIEALLGWDGDDLAAREFAGL